MPIKAHTSTAPSLPFDDPAEVIKRVQDAARVEGRREGREELLAEVQTSLKAIVAQLEKMIKAEHAEAPKKKTPTPRIKRKPQPLRPDTDQARVLDVIKQHPGLKGVEVALYLSGTKERTIRTALRRLRVKRGLIEQRDGRWHLKEGAK